MSSFDDLLNNSPAAASEPQAGQLSKEDYAEKKRAEREEVFALSDRTALEVAGDGGKFRQYLDVQGRFDRYSAVNALLILAQKPEATRIGDFDYWKGMGGFVRPRQSAISILEPHEYTKDDNSPGVGYNIKKVFDISQVDTRRVRINPPPSFTDRQLLGALISKAPVQITGVDELPGDLGAMTNPETGEIFVRKGMEFPDTFRSVAQELCFADLTTGPDSQIDPHFSAYCASYLLCKKYGVDTQDFDFSDAPSILGSMDALEVKGELSQIRDVAGDVSGRMARQLDAVSKAARNQEAR
jgi:hypothetical protein